MRPVTVHLDLSQSGKDYVSFTGSLRCIIHLRHKVYSEYCNNIRTDGEYDVIYAVFLSNNYVIELLSSCLQ